jgi:Arm DNA-binding domain
MALTGAKIRNTKRADKPIKLTDGRGLFLEVRPTGAKLWRYRYRIAGKDNLFAIGEYPALGLAEARATRAEARELVKKGVHPGHNRQAAQLATHTENANTFEAVAREWMAKKYATWSPYYTRQVQRFLEVDVFPDVGTLPTRAVTAAHLLAIVRRVEVRGAETVALMVRQWTSAIFRYAISTLRADTVTRPICKTQLCKR